MKNEIVINLLSDIANFNLSIFGISITVFTVLYAFLLSKKDFIKELNELIKQEKAPLHSVQSVSFALVYIRIWRSLNNHIAVVSFTSISLYFVSVFLKYSEYYVLSIFVVFPVTILLAIYLFYMLIKVFRNYLKETGVN